MKWIVILTTLLAFIPTMSYADEEMPVGETPQMSGWGVTVDPNTTATPAPKPKAQVRKAPDRANEKSADYTPAQDLLLSAMSLIGVKYTWGGNTPESGLDCSGFIRYVFQNSMNMTLPRTAFEMAQTGKNIDKNELKPGDLVFFNTLGRTFSHVGIYLGDNRFIHSPRAGRSVEVANMGQNYWTSRFTGARRMADGGSDGLNINAMLASTSNEAKPTNTVSRVSRVSSVETAKITDSTNTRSKCKKVTTGKGKKRKTTLQCASVTTPNTKEPIVSSKVRGSSRKAPAVSSKAISSRSSKTAKSKTVSTKKTSVKTAVKSSSKSKPVTKSSTKVTKKPPVKKSK